VEVGVQIVIAPVVPVVLVAVQQRELHHRRVVLEHLDRETTVDAECIQEE